ncbi:unnamed protein product [Ilex paraguariensis]|uniref:Uncharacterized protein n=1 Tax=Ilex paraguariensis TaxID=185542 RepID=A0ABC8T9W4_9AQUA
METCGLDADGTQDRRAVSPGTLELICNEQDSVLTKAGLSARVAGWGKNVTMKSSSMEVLTEVYVEQKRLVLTGFWNLLDGLVSCGSIICETLSFVILSLVATCEHQRNTKHSFQVLNLYLTNGTVSNLLKRPIKSSQSP